MFNVNAILIAPTAFAIRACTRKFPQRTSYGSNAETGDYKYKYTEGNQFPFGWTCHQKFPSFSVRTMGAELRDREDNDLDRNCNGFAKVNY